MTSKEDTLIDLINFRVKTRIAPSSIHGVGVFALRDIEEGQRLYADDVPQVYKLAPGSFSKLLDEVYDIIIGRNPRVFVDGVFAYPDTRTQAYINHSDSPNYDPIRDVTIRKIAKDEEITENYRVIEGWEKAFPWLVSNDNI